MRCHGLPAPVAIAKQTCIACAVGAFNGMSPALALSILNPKLVISEAEASAGVQQGVMVTRGNGRQLSPYDLKRLQVRLQCPGSGAVPAGLQTRHIYMSMTLCSVLYEPRHNRTECLCWLS